MTEKVHTKTKFIQIHTDTTFAKIDSLRGSQKTTLARKDFQKKKVGVGLAGL